MREVKIHFVGSAQSGDDLDELRGLAWEDGIISCTRHTWVWAVYNRLKSRGLNVSFGYGLDRSSINFIHGQVARNCLKARDFLDYFMVGIRADFRPFPYGQYEIIQNKFHEGGCRVFMPLFPQPGLIKRDVRRDRVINVCVSGRIQNCFDVTRFERDLREMNCNFVHRGEGRWQDLADIDILLGVRAFSRAPHHSKPPTKLFNAWLAGIPFIGGYDSAYEQVGAPNENYIRVSSYGELLCAVRRLKADPRYYQKLVEAGRKAGASYTVERITDMWVRFLEGQVVDAFKEWSSGGASVRCGAKWRAVRYLFCEEFRKRCFGR